MQLPAGARDGDGSGAGLRDRELGARLRRLRPAARHGVAAAHPLARGDSARPLRRALARRLSGWPVAAASLESAGRACTGDGVRADVRVGARVLPLQGELRRGAREGLPRPDAVGAVHPRLQHPRVRLRRAVPARGAQLDGRRRHARRVVEGRGVARPARDQLPLRRRDQDRGRPRGLQDRPEGAREPARHVGDVHGEARPHVGRLVVSHPLVALERRQGRVRRRARCLQALPRRTDRLRVRAGDLPRADHQLVQAVRRRHLGADDPRLGPRQPHLRFSHRRSRLVAARGDAHSGRRREPVPRVRGAARGGAARNRAEARARPGVRGECVRVRRAALPARAARRDRSARTGNGRALIPRRRGRRPLLELRAHRAAALRPGGHVLRARMFERG